MENEKTRSGDDNATDGDFRILLKKAAMCCSICGAAVLAYTIQQKSYGKKQEPAELESVVICDGCRVEPLHSGASDTSRAITGERAKGGIYPDLGDSPPVATQSEKDDSSADLRKELERQIQHADDIRENMKTLSLKLHEQEQRNAYLSSKLAEQAEYAPNFPEYWRNVPSIGVAMKSITNDFDRSLLTCASTNHGKRQCNYDAMFGKIDVARVQIRRDRNAFAVYSAKRKCLPLGDFDPSTTYLGGINLGIGEYYLLHSTTESHARAILNEGMDLRRCGIGIYGAGMYFTSQLCKAAQYPVSAPGIHKVAKTGDDYYMILARVSPGVPRNLTTPDFPSQKVRVPIGPIGNIVGAPEKGHHSKIVKATPSNLEEVVIFDPSQVYPEFLLHFKIK